MHPEGPATGHLDTGFLGFPLSLSKCWDGSQVPSCYCVPLMQPSRIKCIKIKLPCWQSHYNYIFKVILNLKSKFRGPLSQATASKHSNAFTFTHFHFTLIRRTSGRSLRTFLQNYALSPPHNKVSLTSPRTFHFYLLFYFLSISISLWNLD
jgi:hypothetical protein